MKDRTEAKRTQEAWRKQYYWRMQEEKTQCRWRKEDTEGYNRWVIRTVILTTSSTPSNCFHQNRSVHRDLTMGYSLMARCEGYTTSPVWETDSKLHSQMFCSLSPPILSVVMVFSGVFSWFQWCLSKDSVSLIVWSVRYWGFKQYINMQYILS